MPTVHYISRETLRKHGIDCLPWEIKRDVTPPNKKIKLGDSTDVGTIRAEDLLHATRTTDANYDEDDRKPAAVNYLDPHAYVHLNRRENNIIQQIDCVEEVCKSTGDKNIDESVATDTGNIIDKKDDQKSSEVNATPKFDELKIASVKVEQCKDFFERVEEISNVDTTPHDDKRTSRVNHIVRRHRNFFDRVDKLRAYKEKHGHLNVWEKEDQSFYVFCSNVRQARRAIISGKRTSNKLTEDRIAALDAIGFDWKLEARQEVKSFLVRVDELRAYKEKHGHLNVREKEDQSLYGFCSNVRKSRRAIISGKRRKRTPIKLTEDRIAALDAIGFDWKLIGARSTEVKLMMEQEDAVPIVVAPGRLWLTVAYVYFYCLDLSIRGGAKITAINLACAFRDKVSVGDIIVAFDGKRVVRVEDVSIGTERTRELVIIPMTVDIISPLI